MTSQRTIEVPLSRLGGWLRGFTDRNGELERVDVDGGVVVLSTEQAGRASIRLGERAVKALPPDPGPDDLLQAAARAHRSAAVVLIRRGGWAIGLARCTAGGHEFLATKNGQRYVQGRTAAGGQSQQRFARRRAGQAHALIVAAAQGAILVLGHGPEPVDLLVTGGDRPLLAELMGSPPLHRLVRAEERYVEIADPRRRSLDDALERARGVTIVVRNAEDRR